MWQLETSFKIIISDDSFSEDIHSRSAYFFQTSPQLSQAATAREQDGLLALVFCEGGSSLSGLLALAQP